MGTQSTFEPQTEEVELRLTLSTPDEENNMPLKSTTNTTEIEQQVADLIGRQRGIRDAMLDIRDDLPLSIRFALDRACKAPPEKLLRPSGLEEASELSGRLRSLIRELGGAPTLCHTDEGDPYTNGPCR